MEVPTWETLRAKVEWHILNADRRAGFECHFNRRYFVPPILFPVIFPEMSTGIPQEPSTLFGTYPQNISSIYVEAWSEASRIRAYDAEAGGWASYSIQATQAAPSAILKDYAAVDMVAPPTGYRWEIRDATITKGATAGAITATLETATAATDLLSVFLGTSVGAYSVPGFQRRAVDAEELKLTVSGFGVGEKASIFCMARLVAV